MKGRKRRRGRKRKRKKSAPRLDWLLCFVSSLFASEMYSEYSLCFAGESLLNADLTLLLFSIKVLSSIEITSFLLLTGFNSLHSF